MLKEYENLKGFTIHPYRMKRLQPYYNVYNRDSDVELFDSNVGDVMKAQGLSYVESPRSVYSVEKLFSSLGGYAPRILPRLQFNDNIAAGISLAYSAFAKPREEAFLECLPFTPETISLITSNPDGSAGLTAYGCTKAESQTRALERGIQTLRREKQPEPCLAFKRTQFNGKTRLVWGYPYSMTAIEGLVAYPLNQKFKGGCTPMAFAMASGALGTKLRVASYHKTWCYSLDMSQFDATIQHEVIHLAFKILKTWFDLEAIEPVSGMTVYDIFKIVELYFINTTIVMPNGMIYYGKDHGVPSGSYFTQMIDSVANTIIIGTIASRFNLNISKKDIFVLGDDIMFWSNRRMSLDVIARYAQTTFGVKMHGAEKSAIYRYDDLIHFLGRDWDKGLPGLDTEEITKRMVSPESYRKYSKDPAKRKLEVKRLILSYAAVYWQGWAIAYRLLEPNERWDKRGCANIDVNVFCDAPDERVNPDHLSGLARYRRKYFGLKCKGDIPITAYQYWL